MMGLKDLYTVQPSPLDESALQADLAQQKQSPLEYTRRLAEAKAEALALADAQRQQVQQEQTTNTIHENYARFYLGSDTIVELDDSILEKPKNEDDARLMLTRLSGRQHHVHTGVALYRLGRSKTFCDARNELDHDENDNESTKDDDATKVSIVSSFVDTATVQFVHLNPADIAAYIDSGEPMDKAGSYGIQGAGGQFVKNITGDFFTVMGLPMHRTSQLIAETLLKEE